MKHSEWVWILAIVLVYPLVRIHSLAIPLDRDEGMFGYSAQRILEGGKPYRDALDHKPPGVFYIYALALRFFPATPTGVHLFLLFYNFLTLICVGLLIRVRFPTTFPWLGGAFCYALFSASPAIQGFTASTEMLMLLPISLCLLFAVAARRRGQPLLIVASGAAGSAAFWIKPTAATSVAFAAIYLLAGRWLDDQTPEPSFALRLRDLLLWIMGQVIVSAGVTGYFYFHGLLREFIYWSFTHNAFYMAQISISGTAALVMHSLRGILWGDLVVVGLGMAVAVWNLRTRESDSMFVLGFLVLSMAGALPGFAFPHYFAQLAPAVAVASGWALFVIRQNTKRPAIIVAVLIVALGATPLYSHWDYFFQLPPEAISRSFFGLSPFAESAEVSSFLAAHTSPQDRIFIFGSEPEMLFQAHRRSATPFVMISTVTRHYPRYLEFQKQIWEDIQSSKPSYIVFVNIADSIAWDGKANFELPEQLGQLIRSHYRTVAVMPVRQSPGKLFVIDNTRPIPADVSQNPTNIFIYRRV